jgi:competence protein ComEA
MPRPSPPAPAVVQRIRALLSPEPPEVEPVTVAEVLGESRFHPGRRGALALGCVAVVAALLGAGVMLHGRASEQPLEVPPVSGTVVSTSGPQLVVDVEGKVRRPGLVTVADGARVDDVLKAAGGLLPGASTTGLNLARKVVDGEQLLVGVEPVAGAPGASATAGGLLNLNLATSSDFDDLPGIGPVLADRIVQWRTDHGRFASIDQLREVSGIGEAKYASIKSKVTV